MVQHGTQHASMFGLKTATPDQHYRIFLVQGGKVQNLSSNVADSQIRVDRNIVQAIGLRNERLGGDVRPARPLVLRLVNVVGRADIPPLGGARLSGIEYI